MGDSPHGQPRNIHLAGFGLSYGLMKTRPSKTGLTFGGLVANFYDTYGAGSAKGVLRLAIQANLIVFQGRNRYVVSRATRKV